MPVVLVPAGCTSEFRSTRLATVGGFGVAMPLPPLVVSAAPTSARSRDPPGSVAAVNRAHAGLGAGHRPMIRIGEDLIQRSPPLRRRDRGWNSNSTVSWSGLVARRIESRVLGEHLNGRYPGFSIPPRGVARSVRRKGAGLATVPLPSAVFFPGRQNDRRRGQATSLPRFRGISR